MDKKTLAVTEFSILSYCSLVGRTSSLSDHSIEFEDVFTGSVDLIFDLKIVLVIYNKSKVPGDVSDTILSSSGFENPNLNMILC